MNLNVTLFNSQLNKLNSGMKKVVNLKSSSDVFGDSNGETNFSHKLFLNNTHVSRLYKAFAKRFSR